MCTVSMIMDHYGDKWRPLVQPWPEPYQPWTTNPPQPQPQKALTPEDVARILAPKPPVISAEEIAEFRRLLDRAREYDKRNNEPDCELAEKRDALKVIAAALGVDISFIDAPAAGESA